jgi:hypothetical protein
MDPDFAQRRRVAVALAITAIAAPAAFLLNRGPGDEVTQPPLTVSGVLTGTQPLGTDTENPAASADVMGTAPIRFIEGTAVPVEDDPATIAIPRLGDSITGTASFSRSITNATLCQLRDPALYGAKVTVTNLDNSRSIQCIASVRGADIDSDVVLHADAFLWIADLTDAPVHVQITW